MNIYSIQDPEFREFGKVLHDYQTEKLIDAMNAIPMPEKGTAYETGIDALEALPVFQKLQQRAYGGMPLQLGMCWGHNKQLNCLEYHRCSEINIGATDFILLLGRQSQIKYGMFDTANVMAFRVPKETVVEIYATSMHYAPCQVPECDGFRVAVGLPKGTNEPLEKFNAINREDRRLYARNKWLLCHPDSAEAKQGAYVGLTGENIEI